MFKVADLVFWFETYAEGDITKDAGIGLILKINKYKLGTERQTYTNYTVHRNKHGDTMTFNENYLQIYEGDTNE